MQTTTPSAQYLENWSYVDGFGRDLQSQSASSTSGKRLLSSAGYNDVGQVEYSVAPYEENGVAGSDYLTPTWSSLVGVHQFSYDALGRATKDEMQSNGTALWHTATTYDGWEQTVTDANGHATDYSYDAFGQLTTVVEHNNEGSGAVTYTTGYQYNLLGNLTQVTDHALNVTTMSYDLLGRKTAMTDPDMGTWSYNYNAVGNLTSQQDGNNNWIYLEYDNLHRLTGKRKESVSGTYLSQYEYDKTGFVGQLHKTRSYDAAGTLQVETEVAQIDDRYRPLQTKWHIFGGQHSFTMATSYNAADQVVTTTYPADNGGALGEVVTHSYNSIGQLNQVVSDDTTQYVSAASYNPRGQLTDLTSGSGLSRGYQYNATTMRLEKIEAGISTANDRQELQYSYDNAGNITSLTDQRNSGQIQSFGYDWLDRLTSASTNALGTGQYNHSYSYDAIGNITNMAGSAYSYGATQPHAVTAAHGNNYSYDANGNQTTRTISGTAYTQVFDRENRLIEIKEGSTVLGTFVYDAGACPEPAEGVTALSAPLIACRHFTSLVSMSGLRAAVRPQP